MNPRGFPRPSRPPGTRTPTCQNPYPCGGSRVFAGRGTGGSLVTPGLPLPISSGGLCVNSPSWFQWDLEPLDELVSDYHGGLTLVLDGFNVFVTGKESERCVEKKIQRLW